MAALVIGTLITQIELTVVGTAMPEIGAELHGMQLYPWVFAGFLVANTVATPAAGMLNDVIGRRIAYLAGMFLVTVGSIVCGVAPSMELLIVGRVLQGCGSGALFVTAQTLLGDLFDVEKRARMQSLVWLASAIGAMSGPALGGWIVTNTSWRWAFFATLPVVVAATAFFLIGYVDPKKATKRRLNVRGAGLLTATLAALFLGLGGKGDVSIPLLAAAGGFAVAFLVLERRAQHPILPPDLFANRAFRASALTLFLIGAVQVTDSAYLGLYLQGVAGVRPSYSGYIQAVPMTAMSIICAFFVGKLINKHGYRPIVRIGALFSLLATLALAAAAYEYEQAWTALVLVIAGQAFIGVCHGFATTASIICVQNQVEQARRGTATGSLTLARGLGNTLGPTLLGMLFLAVLATQHLPLAPEQFLNQKAIGALSPEAVEAARHGLGIAMRAMMAPLVGIGAATFLTSLAFPAIVAK